MITLSGLCFPALSLISKPHGTLHPSCSFSLVGPCPSTLHALGEGIALQSPTHRHAHSQLCSDLHLWSPGMPPTASTLHLGFQLRSPLSTDLLMLLSSPCMRSLDSGDHATHSQVPSPKPRLARGRYTANGQVLPPCFLGCSLHVPSVWTADGAPQVWLAQTPVASACLASITRSSNHSTPVFLGIPQSSTPCYITQA